MCDFIPAGPMLFPSLFCCPSFPMLHRKKYLTEGTSVTSYIGHFKPIQNQVQRRRITLCNEKSKWLAGWNPATSQEHPVPTTCCLILHKEKNTLKKSSRKSGLFPWFIPLLFKALSSWEVAGCNILNSVGVRHDKLSQTRTINHFN